MSDLPVPYLPYFTELAMARDWPPGWLPHGEVEGIEAAVEKKEAKLQRARESERQRRRETP